MFLVTQLKSALWRRLINLQSVFSSLHYLQLSAHRKFMDRRASMCDSLWKNLWQLKSETLNNSSYNNFNKQQYHNIQSNSFGHQSHQQQQQQYKPQQHHHTASQASYQSNRNVIPITSYKNEISHDGSYQYSYSTGNGISADESGYLKNRGSPNQAQVAQGSYSYTAPNGQLIQVRYIADELGFRAEGEYLFVIPNIMTANIIRNRFRQSHPDTTSNPRGNPKITSIDRQNTTSSCHAQLPTV